MEHNKTALSSYLERAVLSNLNIFELKSGEKIAKHAAGCDQLHMDFVAVVVTIFGGAGGAPFLDFIARTYLALAGREIAAGGTGSEAAAAVRLLHQKMQASIAKSSHNTVLKHTR